MEHFDVVVIGAGPGGYPAAIRAAQLGASVAVVERSEVGGTCLNWGCIPTKALIASADVYARIREAEAMGVKVSGASVDYAAMIARKDKIVAQLKGGIGQLLKGNGIKLFKGSAAFRDRHGLVVDGTTEIAADKVIIATGSTSVTPGFLPKHPRVVESRAFLALDKLPESMIVLGGGFIGSELAAMAARLGVKVTIVELLPDVLALLDADLRSEVRGHMEKSLGIRMLTGKALTDVTADETGVTGRFGDETLRADLLLNAVGRRPVTDGLNLAAAGLKTTERGFIEADDCCRTKVTGIYAIGDVTGKIQLAHYATAQGIAAAENAVGGKPRVHPSLVPNVIFTAPEVATVGLTEAAAAAEGRAVKTGKFRFAALGKALASGEPGGFVKWIADARTDRLVGAAAVGAHATELIATAAAAINGEFTTAEFGNTIHAHPTLSESWMEAAHSLHGTAIHAPPKKRS